jgi:hypothetical protein
MAKGHRPGGGIASRQRVEKPVRTGQSREGINPRAVSQIGSSFGNHVTSRTQKATGAVERLRDAPRPTAAQVELGNRCALNVGKGGPGAGRTLYGQSGLQRVNDGNLHPVKRGPHY